MSIPVGDDQKAYSERLVRNLVRTKIRLETEIEARREAEENAWAAAKKWQITFDAMLDPVVLLEIDGSVRQCNRAFADFVGRECRDVVGEKCFQLVHGMNGHIQGCPLLRSLQSGEREDMPMSVGGEDFLVVTDPIKGTKGDTTGFVHILRNITELKQVQKRLQESEERYKLALDAAKDGLWDWNPVTGKAVFSPRYYTMLGYEPDEFPASYDFWRSLVHPEELDGIEHAISEHIRNDAGYSLEFRLRTKSGEWRWILGRGRVVERDENGVPVRMVGTHTDISRRKEMERALLESEERFRELYDHAPVGYFEYDSQGNITRVNRTELRMLGYSAEEMIGRPCWQFIVDEGAREQILAKLAGTRPPGHGFERTYRRKNGTTFPVLVEDRLLRDDDGRIRGIRTTIQDITERRQADEALRKSEDKYRDLVENSHDLICTHDLEGLILSMNPYPAHLLGYDRNDLIGMNIREILTPEKVHEFDEYLKTVRTSGTVEGKMIVLTKTGERRIWEFSNTLRTEGVEKPIVRGMARDITEQVRAESEKKKMQAQLLQAQKMESIGRLAGGVAHDFNNMLSVILGYGEGLLEHFEEADPLRKDVQTIIEAANRSAALTRQLLGFARKQVINPRVLDVNDTVSDMLRMLRRLIGEGMDLVWSPGHSLWRVNMDPSQMDQILVNLLVNARDAVSGAGKATIETRNISFDVAFCTSHAGARPGDYVMLAVSDDGCGMGREVREHLFEPFFTTKEVGKGAGMGLPTVYGIVKQNKGFVEVESESGNGTTVSVYLPRVEGEVDEPGLGDAADVPCGRGELVLLVEDEAALLEMGRLLLERLGYCVLIAATPQEAIQLAREYGEEIHLLMTDVVMPEMNGQELARRLCEINPSLRCLFMSGYSFAIISGKKMLDKNVCFMQKPFSLNELAMKVRRALDGMVGKA